MADKPLQVPNEKPITGINGKPADDESARIPTRADEKRQQFWTDAAAVFDRRISRLEGAGLLSAPVWTMPIIVAILLSVGAVLLGLWAVNRTLRS